jgi:acyl-CoA thioester hydrolase
VQDYSSSTIHSSFEFFTPIQIKYSDIDSYLHVNNGIYFQYFEHARAEYLLKYCNWDIFKIGTVVAKVTINYFKPLHIGDNVSVYVKCLSVGRSSFELEQLVFGTSAEGKEFVFAQAQSTMVAVNMDDMKPIPVPDVYRAKMLGGGLA